MSVPDDTLISNQLTHFLAYKLKTCEKSTWRDYKSIIDHYLKPTFGHIDINDLKAHTIRQWINTLNVSNQRINNILIPLRGIYADAYADEIIDRNPLDRIKQLPKRTPEPEPFSKYEMKSILEACEGQVKNIFQFAFWTGLRTSELIALRWSDINMDQKSAYIRRTRCRDGEKDRTKTESGKRKIKLLPLAIEALIDQKKFTTQKDIFLNPRTNEPWIHDGPLRKTAWTKTLKAAQVRYRKTYNTRHTFASLMLSAGINPMWVAQQMGHKDWGMIRAVYGRWIPDIEPNIAENITF